ncbi:MAG: flagellar basal-body MS-ring/collar protein FliF [Thermodesulfobacteriota bacterium]|nr:flagellar basal-body MS-ring/collar protein FliF [Thermodesulfobacteriota bacterium]
MPSRNLFLQLNALFKNFSPGKKITLFLLVGGTIAGFMFLMNWAGTPNYQMLYSGLNPEDAGAIITKLKEQNIQYKISNNGNAIFAPGERIYELRMELASQGLPQGGGVGFEIFDNTKLGMTEFVQNVNYQRALQGELARTINKFSEVESSRVHIVMQSKSLFVEDEKSATASVVLKLRPGRRLNRSQVQGVIHLLSASVSGLNPENVTVVDSHGKMLAGFKDKSTDINAGSENLKFQEKVERDLENRIKTMLESALGSARAIVRLSCLLNFKRYEKKEERYNPDNKVVRSEQIYNEIANGADALPMGIPGMASNISTGEKGKAATGNNTTYQKQDKTVNYEIGKTTSHIIEPVGEIERISVAVLIDGTYKSVKGKKGKKELEYIPRTKEEMVKLENIVKRAMGFDAQRGDKLEIANISFEIDNTSKGDEIGQKEGWFSSLHRYVPLIKYIFSGILILLTFMFVVRPMVQWLTSASTGDVEILKQLPKTVGEIEREYTGGMQNISFREKASQIIKGNNQMSVDVTKSWMKET